MRISSALIAVCNCASFAPKLEPSAKRSFISGLIYNKKAVAVNAKAVVFLKCHFVGLHCVFITPECCCEHQECRIGQVEVYQHAVGYREVVGGEDKLVGPTLKFLNAAVGTYGNFECALHGSTHGKNLLTILVKSSTSVSRKFPSPQWRVMNALSISKISIRFIISREK